MPKSKPPINARTYVSPWGQILMASHPPNILITGSLAYNIYIYYIILYIIYYLYNIYKYIILYNVNIGLINPPPPSPPQFFPGNNSITIVLKETN